MVREWHGLREPPSLCLIAEDRTQPKSKSALMFSRIVFVSDKFVEYMKTVEQWHLNQIAFNNFLPCGAPARLTVKEFHRYNHPGKGLNCFISASDLYVEMSPAMDALVQNQMLFEMVKRMEGWYIRSFYACLLHESVIQRFEQLGFARMRSYPMGEMDYLTIVALDRAKAMSGGTPFSPFFLTLPARCGFSPRERQVLALLMEECLQAEVGSLLGMTERTVETHCKHIRGKFERTLGIERPTLKDVLRYVRSHPEEVRAISPK